MHCDRPVRRRSCRSSPNSTRRPFDSPTFDSSKRFVQRRGPSVALQPCGNGLRRYQGQAFSCAKGLCQGFGEVGEDRRCRCIEGAAPWRVKRCAARLAGPAANRRARPGVMKTGQFQRAASPPTPFYCGSFIYMGLRSPCSVYGPRLVITKRNTRKRRVIETSIYHR